MIEIFICDDDKNITEYLKSFILKCFKGKYKVLSINSCCELLGMIDTNERVPDILIMDITFKDGNGIDIVKRIQEYRPAIKVIYLTGNINFATDIFKTNPSYFLVKPIKENILIDAIEKVGQEVIEDKSDHIFLKSNGSEIILFRKEIRYVESRGRKIVLFLSNGKQAEIYQKMDAIQEQLGHSFVRSHKSFLINMRYITERTNKKFYLSTGEVLPISKPHLKESKEKFISYLGEDV